MAILDAKVLSRSVRIALVLLLEVPLAYLLAGPRAGAIVFAAIALAVPLHVLTHLRTPCPRFAKLTACLAVTAAAYALCAPPWKPLVAAVSFLGAWSGPYLGDAIVAIRRSYRESSQRGADP